MWFDFFRDKAKINVGGETFGVAFTHWGRRHRSWSLRWNDVATIEAMLSEVACIEFRFVFKTSDGRVRFVSDDMENWNVFERELKKRCPEFNWEAVTTARVYANKNKGWLCWNSKSAGKKMNYNDIRFITITAGVGIGLGIGLARKHGIMGFVSGVGIVTVISFALLSIVRLLSASTKKRPKPPAPSRRR